MTKESSAEKNNKSVKQMLNKFSEKGKGIGKLRDVQVKLYIDESVQPVIQQYRKVPFPLRSKVEQSWIDWKKAE